MDASNLQNYHQNQQSSYGLLRFRSAPCSLLGSFVESAETKVRSSEGFEADKFSSGFMNYSNSNGDSRSQSLQMFEEKSPPSSGATATEAPVGGYANSPRGYSGLPPQYPRQSCSMDASYSVVSSIGADHQTPVKSVNSSVMRRKNSPPGLFSDLSVDNGYAAIRGSTNYRLGNGVDGEVSPSRNRLSNQISFSSGLSSSLGTFTQISEFGSENFGSISPDEAKAGIGNGNGRSHGPGYLCNSWNDSSNFSQSFIGLNRDPENGLKKFSGDMNGNLGSQVHLLSHHMSLPKTSSNVEKFLHFQDSVPCKIRAKRGCATHPRSIAERVRRTRISERMRKLQELVPNMDKQTNTADMLDLAVDYIKDLQKQFKILSDNRANCKCLSTHKPASNQIV